MDGILEWAGVIGGLLRLLELFWEAFTQWLKEGGGFGGNRKNNPASGQGPAVS